eukprot:911582_1
MSVNLSALILLSYVSRLISVIGLEEVLASTNACAYSTTFTATIFNAPRDGQITGIKAVYNAANSAPGMTCASRCSRTNWGCEHCGQGRKFMVEMMKVTDASSYSGYTIYPISTTTGYISGGLVSCSRGCTQQLYYMTGQDIDDDAITWDGATYDVTKDDKFMLQCGEGCCDTTTSDNLGHVCAQIYFLYRTTNNPTLLPSVNPTAVPTNNPTNVPTNNPTLLPSMQPTSAPTSVAYEMKPIPGHYICGDLSNSKYVVYNTTFTRCMNYHCWNDDDCVMINYIPNLKTLTDSRCYIFDTQCNIYNDAGSGNSIAIRSFDNMCLDYPYDWTDKYVDDCARYEELGWCINGDMNTANVSVDDIIDHMDFKYNLNANQVCCECGGGAHLIDRDVLISVETSIQSEGISAFDNGLLCDWRHRHVSSYQWRTYDNLELFDLCLMLKETTYRNYKFVQDEHLYYEHMNDINCNIMIDQSYEERSDLFICNYDSSPTELYFMTLFVTNGTSVKIFVNEDWFSISLTLLSNNVHVQAVPYADCLSELASLPSEYAYYGIFPCDIDVKTSSFAPSDSPSPASSLAPSKTSSSPPTLSPSSHVPIATMHTNGYQSTEMPFEESGEDRIILFGDNDLSVVIVVILSLILIALLILIVLKLCSSPCWYCCQTKTSFPTQKDSELCTLTHGIQNQTEGFAASNLAASAPIEDSYSHEDDKVMKAII